MDYLLDTHAFIWWALEPDKLPEKVLKTIESSHNGVFLSIASIWEMQIKIQLNKLHLPLSLSELLSQQQTINHIELLPIEPSHIYALESLSLHHKDPFDRMLIAQSSTTHFVLISKDPEFSNYPINLFW
jgi:PIN domain nuclease of toxin-antitoxin system